MSTKTQSNSKFIANFLKVNGEKSKEDVAAKVQRTNTANVKVSIANAEARTVQLENDLEIAEERVTATLYANAGWDSSSYAAAKSALAKVQAEVTANKDNIASLKEVLAAFEG